jgi:serine/threonine protein kinase, bacterial
VALERIGSHYLLHEQIGQGGMGAVWRAEDVATGNWRAVKVLKPEYARDPAAVARFVRERNALLALQHPNVVTLHDMIVEGERLALVMDLLTEGDLDKFRRDHGGTLPPWLAAELVAQVCDGLAAAHAAGIVHRDLKPGNVLMDRGRPRLTDFGIARIGGDASVTTAGMVMGTVRYMAPEALAGAEPAPACDVYAAGVTLYELLAGRPPFTGQAAMVIHDHLHAAPQRPDGLPDPLWQLIAACLSKDPAARPTVTQVAAALRHPGAFAGLMPQPGGPWAAEGATEVLAGTGPHTITGIGWLSPAGPVPRGPVPPGPMPALAVAGPVSRNAPWKRRRTWLIAAAAVLLAAAAGIGAFTADASGGTAQPAAGSVTAPTVTATTSLAGLGRSSDPTPSHSAHSAAPRTSHHPASPTAAPPTTAPPPATTAADPPTTDPTVTVTATPATPVPSTVTAPAPTPSAHTCSASPPAGISFWRCNGTAWVPTSCAVGEYNAAAGPFNVLEASNKCTDRVWLHQDKYPQDAKSGWAYCISPGAPVEKLPALYSHPLNIQVSSNPSKCL